MEGFYKSGFYDMKVMSFRSFTQFGLDILKYRYITLAETTTVIPLSGLENRTLTVVYRSEIIFMNHQITDVILSSSIRPELSLFSLFDLHTLIRQWLHFSFFTLGAVWMLKSLMVYWGKLFLYIYDAIFHLPGMLVHNNGGGDAAAAAA